MGERCAADAKQAIAASDRLDLVIDRYKLAEYGKSSARRVAGVTVPVTLMS